MSKKEVSTETFSQLWAETEAEFASENSEGTDNATETEQVEEGQSDVDDGKPAVLGALTEDDSQPVSSGTKIIEIPGVGSFSEEEAKAAFMKDKDYRQKTADLAREREALKEAEHLWEALQKDPVATVKKLAQDIQAGVIQPGQPPKVETQDDIDKLVAAKVAEALEQNDGLKDVRQARALRAVEAAFSSIEKAENVKLNQADRALVISKAQELGTTDLHFVFNGLLRAAEKASAAKNNAKATSTTTGGRNESEPSTEKPKSSKPASFRELAEETLKEMGLDKFASL